MRTFCRPPSDNIGLICDSIKEVPALQLKDPISHVGSRILNCSSRVTITIPAAPPSVFEQWHKAWFQQCYLDAAHAISIGTDGSYMARGQGSSAFVVLQGNQVVHTYQQLVAAHSSYDAKMIAIHSAIEHVMHSLTGHVMVFIDNQVALKSLLQVQPHALYELSCQNSCNLQQWLMWLDSNHIEF